MSVHQCLVCGEKFSLEVKFCPGCGADQKSIQVIESEELNNTAETNIPETKGKNKPDLKSEPVKKSLSKIKLIYLLIFLFFVGSIIIYSSGIFDSPKVVSSNVNEANPHSGVNLENLQEINRLEDAVKNNPADYNSLLNLAHLLNDSGFKEKAIDRYIEYLKNNPKSPDVLVDLGVCYYELGQNENAIKNMEKAIRVEPKHQIAHLNLGIVNFSMGNKAIAKEYWKKAVAIDPATEIAKRAEELINQH